MLFNMITKKEASASFFCAKLFLYLHQKRKRDAFVRCGEQNLFEQRSLKCVWNEEIRELCVK